MAAEVSWWTRAKKDTDDSQHLTSLADLQPPNGTKNGSTPEGDANGATPKRVTFADGGDDDGAPRAANLSLPSFVDDALGSPPARDNGAEESKAPGFVPRRDEAPYVTAEQELYRRALDESSRLERRAEERDRRRPSGCLSNPVGWCLDATSPL